MRQRTYTRPPGHCLRHWFAYYGMVGSSSPVCVRCGARNPTYRPDEDPFRDGRDLVP